MATSFRTTNFYPLDNKTVPTPGTTATQVQFTQTFPNSGTPGIMPSSLEITNNTNQVIFVAWGPDNTVVASASSYAVAVGVDKIIEIGAPNAYVSIYAGATATGNVYLCKGRGN